MRKIVKLSLILFVITVIAAFVLSYTNNITQAIILEKAEAANREKLAAIFPDADEFVKITGEQVEKDYIMEVYEALKGEQALGYTVKTDTVGYSGSVVVLSAFSKEGNIIAVKVISQSETPGLGDLIVKDSFTGMFEGKDADTEFRVVKDGGSKEGDIQSLSGATISSNAVVKGVNAARTLFLDVLENR